MSFRASCNDRSGHLVIEPSGVRFQANGSSKDSSRRILYFELVEMWKLAPEPRSAAKNVLKRVLVGKERLCFKELNDKVMVLEIKKGRDDAFNFVLGFSGLQWQSLQTEPTMKENLGEDHGWKGAVAGEH